MNPTAILALISDLVTQITELRQALMQSQQRITEIERANHKGSAKEAESDAARAAGGF